MGGSFALNPRAHPAAQSRYEGASPLASTQIYAVKSAALRHHNIDSMFKYGAS